jgi:hypothetical protein
MQSSASVKFADSSELLAGRDKPEATRLDFTANRKSGSPHDGIARILDRREGPLSPARFQETAALERIHGGAPWSCSTASWLPEFDGCHG